MTRDEVLKVRDNFSDSFKSRPDRSPWTIMEAEMFKKTLVKRVYKVFPKTKRLEKLDKTLSKRPDADELTTDIDYGIVDEDTGEMIDPTIEAEVVENNDNDESTFF